MRVLKPSPCDFCLITKSCEFALPCGHRICSAECLQELIRKQTENRIENYSITKCLVCDEKIPRELLCKAFGGEDSFRNSIRLSSRMFEPKLLCEFCYIELPASDFITLECNHRACQACMKSFVESFINEGKVGKDISCPHCQAEIDYHIISNVIDSETQTKYDNFLMRRVEATAKNEVYLVCISKPGANCDFAEFISVDREEYSCPKCQAHFCAKCKQDWHPKLSCAQFKLMQGVDPHIQDDIKNDRATYCPWCDVLITRNGGCKYITCVSEACAKKKYFCWDCKAKLTEVHQVHKCHTPDVISNKIKAACCIF